MVNAQCRFVEAISINLLSNTIVKIARVISSLLAAAILNMRGVSGKPGWFWLFLLEGILTFLIGLIVSSMSREAVLLRTQPTQIFQG